MGVFSIPILLAILLGIAIGLAAGYATFPAIREAKRLRIQLDEQMREHENYKTTVSAHFRKTGELVGEMTRSYAAVYDHLASGARTFGSVAAAESTLTFGPSPGILASPVIETSTDSAQTGSETGPPVEAAPIEASDSALDEASDSAPIESSDSAPIEASDSALDGSMLAAEVFVGTEGGLDSASETTVSSAESSSSDQRHKA